MMMTFFPKFHPPKIQKKASSPDDYKLQSGWRGFLAVFIILTIYQKTFDIYRFVLGRLTPDQIGRQFALYSDNWIFSQKAWGMVSNIKPYHSRLVYSVILRVLSYIFQKPYQRDIYQCVLSLPF